MVRRARQHHELMWRFLPVPLENLRLVMHTDAAFQNAQGGASQAGYIIAVTDDRLASGEMAPWCPLIWRSHKIRRIVCSTLAAETQSLLNGLGHAEWIAAHFAEARFPDFDVAQRSTVLRHFRLQCIVDAESLYDHLVSVISVQCGRQTLWVRFGHLTAMHGASWSRPSDGHPPIVNLLTH